MKTRAHILKIRKFFSWLFFIVALGAPALSFAAGCCVYAPDPTNDAVPSWIKNLKDNTVFFEKTKSDCPDPKNVPSLAGLAQYYLPYTFPSSCSAVTQDQDAQTYAAITAAKDFTCCVLNDGATPVSCTLKKGSTDSCVAVLGSQATESKSITSFKGACSDAAPCQILANGKEHDQKGTTVGADAQSSTQNAWKKEECEKVLTPEGEKKYVWIPPQDNPAVTIGDYCFARPLKTQLEIPIGSIGTIKSLSHYINTVYKYIIGCAVLAIILTIVVSGFQWMVSGIADQIGAAKKRIGNALIGLLLLLGANIVVYTINPQILELRAPPIKAIRPEKFGVEKKIACDPTDETSCAKSGPDYYCEPTYEGLAKACDKQTRVFLGAVFGAAAATVAAPFALSAAGTAITSFQTSVATNGLGQTLFAIGRAGVNEYATEAATDAVGKKIGKAVAPFLLAAGAAAAGGVAGAYAVDKIGPPPDGLCVQAGHDKQDGLMCSSDKECASDKCLVTNLTCTVRKLGVCVSGKILEPCSLDDVKYACVEGDCIKSKSSGVSKVGIDVGFCSDGTKIGMPCDNDKIKCDKVQGASAECIQDTCREKGYFTEEGVVYNTTVWNPTCILPTECLPEDYQLFSGGGKIITAPDGSQYQITNNSPGSGCLKPADPATNLPARLLLPAKLGALDETYYREFASIGFCVVNGNTNYRIPTAYTSSCMVNVRPSDSADGKKLAAAITQQYQELAKTFPAVSAQKALPAALANGFRVDTVGCGIGSCGVSVTDFFTSTGAFTLPDGTMSLVGLCKGTVKNGQQSGVGTYQFFDCDNSTSPLGALACTVAVDSHMDSDVEHLTTFEKIGDLYK